MRRRLEEWVERVWYPRNTGAVRAGSLLSPLGWMYGVGVRLRNAGYDLGWLASQAPAIPVVSVGNLSVGGTGKTPVAAWLASEFRRRGGRPAIVMRGYGADEPLVHRALNPDVPVIVDRDRVRGVREAALAGADVAILDDGFQHRRARRVIDIVLMSADRPTVGHRLLPAGPWREPLSSLGRARLIMVTDKTGLGAAGESFEKAIRARAPRASVAYLRLVGEELRGVGSGETQPLEFVRGKPVRLITSIADPGPVVKLLAGFGAVVELERYPDHHEFSREEIARLGRSGRAGELTVCTLKDGVKLGPQWPREALPLWYVSQRVHVQRGQDAIERILGEVLDARPSNAQTAGLSQPRLPTNDD